MRYKFNHIMSGVLHLLLVYFVASMTYGSYYISFFTISISPRVSLTYILRGNNVENTPTIVGFIVMVEQIVLVIQYRYEK